MKFLFFDTETTGLPSCWKYASTPGVWPDIVSIAWILTDEIGTVLSVEYHIVRPEGWTIPASSSAIHGIFQDLASGCGIGLHSVIERFHNAALKADVIISHNMRFDENVIDNAILWRIRNGLPMRKWGKRLFCTMKHGISLCKLPSNKQPRLSELYNHAFGLYPSNLHNALQDTELLKACFFMLWNPSRLPEDTVIQRKNAPGNPGNPSVSTKLVLSLAQPDETV